MDRRKFIKHGSMGAAGVVALEQILGIREAFSTRLADAFAAAREAEDYSKLRGQYMLNADVTYFNHASIGTIPRAVQEAQQKYLELCESNPWLYIWGGAWEEAREETRSKSAELLGCTPGEMVLTHNTTEGFNLLAQDLQLGAGDEVMFSSLNHAGASVCWFHRAAEKGFVVKKFDFPILDAPTMTEQEILDAYDRHISSKTRVLVFPHIDNIIGLRHPVQELAKLARSKGVEFVAVDGAQSAGMIEIDTKQMGVDFFVCSPHKWLQSPKGLGMMYIRKNIQKELKPMWVTWGQERWKGTSRIFEDYGTRNLPEILTLGDAIDYQTKLGSNGKLERYRELWSYLQAKVEDSSALVWRSPKSWSLASSVYAVEVKGRESREVARNLFTDYGIVVRPFSTQGLNTLRVSPNVFNTADEIDRLCQILEKSAKA